MTNKDDLCLNDDEAAWFHSAEEFETTGEYVVVEKKVDSKIAFAARKVPLNLIPLQALMGPSRVYQYGTVKHGEGNYYQADIADGAPARYIGGVLRHISSCQAPSGLFTPESIATLDEESGLPEIDHAICGLLMLRSIAVKCGVLPADPGIGNNPVKP